jgi:surface antigen
MNLGLLYLVKKRVSMKKVAVLVIATLVVLIALPIGAVFALTNLPLLAVEDVLGGSAENQTVYDGSVTPGDGYEYGYCTYWAALRRIQIGDPIPNNWGNAITWNVNAILDGYVVNHTPSFGAIFQWPSAPGGEGHVAFVESVDPTTGAWTISEMNAVGWDVVDNKTYPASAAQDYNFIHDKSGALKGNSLLNK